MTGPTGISQVRLRSATGSKEASKAKEAKAYKEALERKKKIRNPAERKSYRENGWMKL